MDAARAWACGVKASKKKEEEQLRRQAEDWGMQSDVFRELPGEGSADDPEDFEIFEDNSEAVETFLCCSGRWQMWPSGRYKALDHAALGASMGMLGVENPRAVYLDVQIMESAARDELNRRN
ncbi:MAG TPA: DUF1799 domain-containing protein [Gallionellaceae bacterium]|nr:DUF1799 domain-containing protein [Gallionellaceae bacterium]